MGTVKLSTLIGQSEANIIKALNQEIVHPWEDAADSAYTSASKQTVTAGTEYAFQVNRLAYSAWNLPDFMGTYLWDTNNHKIIFTPQIQYSVFTARVQLNFAPQSAAEGYIDFKAYICEETPALIQTIRVPYKTTDTRLEALFSFYVGDDTGYNMKLNGLKFTYTPKANGGVYDRGILIFKN